jgi:hypothetical protein
VSCEFHDSVWQELNLGVQDKEVVRIALSTRAARRKGLRLCDQLAQQYLTIEKEVTVHLNTPSRDETNSQTSGSLIDKIGLYTNCTVSVCGNQVLFFLILHKKVNTFKVQLQSLLHAGQWALRATGTDVTVKRVDETRQDVRECRQMKRHVNNA